MVSFQLLADLELLGQWVKNVRQSVVSVVLRCDLRRAWQIDCLGLAKGLGYYERMQSARLRFGRVPVNPVMGMSQEDQRRRGGKRDGGTQSVAESRRRGSNMLHNVLSGNGSHKWRLPTCGYVVHGTNRTSTLKKYSRVTLGSNG
jgi:hypothetical protein